MISVESPPPERGSCCKNVVCVWVAASGIGTLQVTGDNSHAKHLHGDISAQGADGDVVKRGSVPRVFGFISFIFHVQPNSQRVENGSHWKSPVTGR